MSTAVIPEPNRSVTTPTGSVSQRAAGAEEAAGVTVASCGRAGPNPRYVSHGTAATLDYMGLKKRMGGPGGISRLRGKASQAAFIELIAPHAATLQRMRHRVRAFGGGKVRIQWKAAAPPDWTSLRGPGGRHKERND